LRTSPAAVEEALYLYIDGWYNSRRIQEKLGYRSPEDFETTWKEEQATRHQEARDQGERHRVRACGGRSSGWPWRAEIDGTQERSFGSWSRLVMGGIWSYDDCQ
jgi:hypothetical protein